MIVLGFGYESSKNVIILQTIDGLVKTYWNTISLILIIFSIKSSVIALKFIVGLPFSSPKF